MVFVCVLRLAALLVPCMPATRLLSMLSGLLENAGGAGSRAGAAAWCDGCRFASCAPTAACERRRFSSPLTCVSHLQMHRKEQAV